MKHLIFDFDGTLANTQSKAAYHLEVFAKANNLPQWDAHKFHVNYTDPDTKDLGFGVALQDQRALYHGFVKFVSTNIEVYPDMCFSVFDGIPVMLKALNDNGKQMYIATSRDRNSTEVLLRYNGIDSHFPHIVTETCMAQRGLRDKPHPDMIDHLVTCGVDKTQAIVIGDTTNDIKMAKAAGLPVIAVSYGSHGENMLCAEHPDYLVHSTQELAELLIDI